MSRRVKESNFFQKYISLVFLSLNLIHQDYLSTPLKTGASLSPCLSLSDSAHVSASPLPWPFSVLTFAFVLRLFIHHCFWTCAFYFALASTPVSASASASASAVASNFTSCLTPHHPISSWQNAKQQIFHNRRRPPRSPPFTFHLYPWHHQPGCSFFITI